MLACEFEVLNTSPISVECVGLSLLRSVFCIIADEMIHLVVQY